MELIKEETNRSYQLKFVKEKKLTYCRITKSPNKATSRQEQLRITKLTKLAQ